MGFDKLKKPLMYINMGIDFGVAIGLGAFIGYVLDNRFHTNPYLTLIFFLFGLAAAIRNLLKDLKVIRETFDDKKD